MFTGSEFDTAHANTARCPDGRPSWPGGPGLSWLAAWMSRSETVRLGFDKSIFFGYIIRVFSTKGDPIMKIETKAVIRRRIRNIKADIQSVRNSGNTYRMRILYAQLTAATIKLHNMTH